MTGKEMPGSGLVIFDCDGVLVDSEPISIRCTAAALNRFGYPIDGDGVFDRFLGASTASMVATVEASLGRPLAPEALDDLRREILAAFDRDLTAIPGVVFSGGVSGFLRAYATDDAKLLWEFDTAREYTTVNGVPGHGGAMDGPGPVVVDGMLYVNSGYAQWSGLPGNVLLAFEVGNP